MARFVNREKELGQLTRWWETSGAGMAIVWGRRRVGKTALLQHFAVDRPAVFHTGGGRPAAAELAALSRAAAPLLSAAGSPTTSSPSGWPARPFPAADRARARRRHPRGPARFDRRPARSVVGGCPPRASTAARGGRELGPSVVAIGPYWSAAANPSEIDAVVLSGRDRHATMVGEAKWARRVDAHRLRTSLERKAHGLPTVASGLRCAICARGLVENPGDALVVTAADVFALS